MSLFWMIIEFTLTAIEVGLLYIFFSRMMEFKNIYNKFQAFIGACLVSILIFLFTIINVYSTWKIILGISLYAVYSVVFFNAVLYKKVLFALLVSSLYVFTDIFAVLIVSAMNNVVNWDFALQQDINRIATFCISKIVFIIITTIVTHFRNDLEVQLPLKYWLIFLFSFSIILIAVLVQIDVGFSVHRNTELNHIIMIIMLTLLILYLSIYYLFYQLCGYYIKSNKKSIIQYQNEAIQNYIIQKEETDNIIRVLSHDLKHILSSLREYIKNDNSVEAFKLIEAYESVFEENRLIDVGNNIANAIINQKLLVAKKNNIEFEVRGVFFENMNISSIDLCAVLGNTLDNALEATMKLDENQFKRIKISIKKEGCFLFYEVENYFKVKPIVKNSVFISIKNQKENHGIGMLSINNVVMKYDGSYENIFNENVFKTIIMLRVYS